MTNLAKKLIFLCCVVATVYSSMAKEEVRDPTKPVVKDPTGLDLQGISETEGNYYCVISKKIYTQGDKILDFKISRIEFEKVIFEDNEGKVTEISL